MQIEHTRISITLGRIFSCGVARLETQLMRHANVSDGAVVSEEEEQLEQGALNGQDVQRNCPRGAVNSCTKCLQLAELPNCR